MGKIMVVTGAGRGIGAAVARVAGARGYDVCVNYARSQASAEAIASEIRSKGQRAIAVQADVSRDDEVKRLFAEVDRQLGRLDVLVNNAGIIGRQCRADEMDPALLQQVFAANTFSVFYCNREALRRMSTRHGGRGGAIVTISSVAARHGGLPMETPYAASKGALDSMTVGLAKEVGKEGVRVNAIRPGMIVTEIHEAHGGQATIDSVAPTVPIGRAGTPEEIAETVLWLASDAASYVHGAVIEVSGGR
ncbi:MAG: SDR family oxidoreductase [Betaproteobacteria bacterium]|jgi:NAD(P)-dependent dehydrogenase (short-subunit alcohol dehydrogenase family)|nr:SDR family oxidoreductase [Betaproteobacteria bacterium]